MLTRDHAAAFLVATTGALAGNAVLQLGLEAVRVARDGSGAPWWVTAEIVERGRWVVFALLLYAAAPACPGFETASAPADAGDRHPWARVGAAVALVPLVWIAATWLVTALRFTLLGSWDTDGRVFLSAGYYRAVALDYVPWLIGGTLVLLLARHRQQR